MIIVVNDNGKQDSLLVSYHQILTITFHSHSIQRTVTIVSEGQDITSRLRELIFLVSSNRSLVPSCTAFIVRRLSSIYIL